VITYTPFVILHTNPRRGAPILTSYGTASSYFCITDARSFASMSWRINGQGNSSRYTYPELRKALKEADAQVYCIGIVELDDRAGDTLDRQGQAILEEIAQVTGGCYPPANQGQDRKWRKIRVRVNPPHAEARRMARDIGHISFRKSG